MLAGIGGSTNLGVIVWVGIEGLRGLLLADKLVGVM